MAGVSMTHVVRTTLAAAVALALIGPAGAGEHGGTLKKIKDTGTLVIGHREASRPFSFVNDKNEPAGYSVDLCLRIATAIKETLGMEKIDVKYTALTADNRIDKVADGAVDIECGNTTQTLSRQERVDFTNMIFITGASLLTRAEGKINGVADLRGKTVSVVVGTTTENALDERLAEGLIDAKVLKVKDHNEGMAALDAGKVDAHAGDQLILIGLAKASPDQGKYALASELFSYEPYGLMIRRNDADFRLVANRALSKLYRSGEIGSVYQKWFGEWGGRPSQLLLAMFALNSFPE
jgi:ABC-type amino acid transport substrate-binding protein